MKVSVILSVYNSQHFIADAVESILTQTYRNFELIIIDDGSTDGTRKMLTEIAQMDTRVRILTNETNIGLTRSLNRALQEAHGNYIARMDADDIAFPNRLERQVAFLDARPEVGIVGATYQFINDAGQVIEEKHPPIYDRELRRALIRYNPFLHSSVMIRKELLDRVSGYDESFQRAQDYDLWMRLSPLCELANLPETLMQKRFTTHMVSYAREREQIRFALRVRLSAIARGQYPTRCLIFLIKPFLATILPSSLVRLARVHIFGQKMYRVHHLSTLPPSHLRLLFLITKSEAGGAQTHVAQLTKFFLSRGDEVAIMSAPGGWLEQEAGKLGAQFISNQHLGKNINPIRLFIASRALTKAVKIFKPDLVACHSTVAGILGRLTLRNRVPTIFTAHGWGFTQGAPIARRIITPFFEHAAAQFCDKIIVVSRNDLGLARHNRIANDSKLTLIHNGVELETPRSRPISKTITHIFFVGRLAQPKDPVFLIDAIARLPEESRERIKLTIVGDGPLAKNVRDRIRSNALQTQIEMTGAMTRDKIIDRLQAQADVFALISNWEGFPYTILEAMALGIPVIASDVGGVSEAVDDSVGRLIARNDMNALNSALQDAVKNPNAWKEKGLRARQKVETQFSLQQMRDKTLSVYQDVLLKRRAG